jgi:hypothetical protein
MEHKFNYTDGSGNHEAKVDLGLYKSEKGFVAELNTRYPTQAGMPTASEQLFAQCGFFRKDDPANGIKSARVRNILDGMDGIALQGAATAPGSNGISRLVVPAALLTGIQNDLYEDKSGVLGQFKQLVGMTQMINGNRYERPVFNYDPARNSRAKPTAQLSEPTSIGLLTVGEQSGTIPVFSHGLEISDQAMDYFGFAEVQKCMSIMVAEDMAERADDWLLSMVNGDADHGMGSLASVGGTVTAASYDATIVAAGNLTQKAFMLWIAAHSKRAPITHIITDINGALAIQNRSGRPNVMGDNPMSNRIDTVETIMNEMWPTELPIYIVTDASWPANLILGINKPNAICMYESSSASFNSVESFYTRRSTKFRADFGAVALRFYDRAFHGLSLTV